MRIKFTVCIKSKLLLNFLKKLYISKDKFEKYLADYFSHYWALAWFSRKGFEEAIITISNCSTPRIKAYIKKITSQGKVLLGHTEFYTYGMSTRLLEKDHSQVNDITTNETSKLFIDIYINERQHKSYIQFFSTLAHELAHIFVLSEGEEHKKYAKYILTDILRFFYHERPTEFMSIILNELITYDKKMFDDVALEALKQLF